MGKTARLIKIRELLLENGQVDIAALCEMFNVSSVTIRQNLSELESEGFLVRTHGGAVLRENKDYLGTVTVGASSPLTPVLKKKIDVARVAADYIPDNIWLYLSSGQTCYEMGKFLLNRRVNIVTGGLPTALLLGESDSLSVLVPGGNLIKTKDLTFLAGDWYFNALDSLSFDMAFVGFAGVDLKAGLSVDNPLEHKLILKIREVSKKVIVPVDSTKFGHRAFMSVADLDYADVVITNSDVPQEYRDYFKSHNIELITD